MTNMAAMPIYDKNLKKSSSPEQIDWWPWNIVCSIVYASTTKVVQIMTLGWPWSILRQGQIWSHRLLYGKKWKLLFFGNYCSLRSQSCLKHSAKWVNEVEWVSKVKVILWPQSKVTQISKLKLVFSQKHVGDLEPKLIWKLKWEWEWKFIQMSWVTWPTWLPCPNMVKILKNLLLQKQKIDDLETWYVALSMRVLPGFFKLWPGVDLDPLYATVKFGHIGFCMGKK